MVSISAPQGSAQAKGYLSTENYYQQNSERGYFYGHALEHFGLTNGQEVTPELYDKLLEGYHPVTGEKLVKNAGDKDRRAGIDVTFSAPKSVSVLMEYHEATGDKSHSLNLRNAHDLAVKKAMRILESRYAKTRVYNDQGERVKVQSDLAYATFQHDTAREILGQIDPQLHSHNFIFSMVTYDDPMSGKTKTLSLSNEEIYQNKMYLGQLYRSEFAKNLRELGYTIEVSDRLNGFFEIEGFSKDQLEEFSGRSKLIRELLPNYREKYPKMDENELLQLIVKDTKKAKKEVDREQLRLQNLDRMRAVGIDKVLVENVLKHEPLQIENREEVINTHLEKSLDNLTQKMSVFTHEDLLKESLKYGLEYAFNEQDYLLVINQKADIVQLDHNVFSTQKMIDAERNIIHSIHQERGKSDHFSSLKREELAQFLEEKYANMTNGQREMVQHIFSTNDRFIAVQGDAGSGKTYAAKAVKEFLEEKFPDQNILGLAYTGKAAEGLEKDSGIKSQTVHSFLSSELKSDTSLILHTMDQKESTKNRVILIDEASMAGSLQINEIVEIAKRNNDKVVFIGDTKQFRSISAGRAFADMQKYGIKTVKMDEVLRQESDHAKASVTALKDQKIQQAIEVIKDNGKLYEKSVSEQLNEVSTHYSDLLPKDQKDTLIITSTNKERRELNDMIREKLGKKGSLYTVRENLNYQGMRSHYAENYKEGYFIAIQGKVSGFKDGQQFQIVNMKDENTLIVKGLKEGARERELDVFQHGNALQVYRETPKQFSRGDLIIFTKNTIIDQKTKQKVKNGERTTIKSLDKKGNVVTENGKRFNLNKMNYVDHGYAITDVKSQGTTVKDVVIMANASMASMNSFYTQITRAKRDITLYTNNVEEFKANIENTKEDRSTLDYTIRIKDKECYQGEYTLKSLMKGKEHGRSYQEHIRTFDYHRDTKQIDIREATAAGGGAKYFRRSEVIDPGNQERGSTDQNVHDRAEQRDHRNIYDLSCSAGAGRSGDRRGNVKRAKLKANQNKRYSRAIEKITQKREANARRNERNKRKERIDPRRGASQKRLASIGVLQFNPANSERASIQRARASMHRLSERNLVRNKPKTNMLLQMDVRNSMGTRLGSDLDVRRSGNVGGNGERKQTRGVDVKASFKEYMKQSRGKDVNVLDKAATKEPGREKKHSAETIKQFVKQKQNKQREKSRDRGKDRER